MTTGRIPPNTADAARFADALRGVRGAEKSNAESILADLCELYPEDPAVWGQRGFLAFRCGEHDEGARCLRRATSLDPRSELWSIGLFHSLWGGGKTDEAFAEARRFLSLPGPADAYAELLSDMAIELGVRDRTEPK